MTVVGKTQSGDRIVSGLASLYFQEGIPPSLIFDFCKNFQILPSFPAFYDELRANGMSHDRIIHLLSEHVFETYGKEYRDVVIDRLKAYGSSKTP